MPKNGRDRKRDARKRQQRTSAPLMAVTSFRIHQHELPEHVRLHLFSGGGVWSEEGQEAAPASLLRQLAGAYLDSCEKCKERLTGQLVVPGVGGPSTENALRLTELQRFLADVDAAAGNGLEGLTPTAPIRETRSDPWEQLPTDFTGFVGEEHQFWLNYAFSRLGTRQDAEEAARNAGVDLYRTWAFARGSRVLKAFAWNIVRDAVSAQARAGRETERGTRWHSPPRHRIPRGAGHEEPDHRFELEALTRTLRALDRLAAALGATIGPESEVGSR